MIFIFSSGSGGHLLPAYILAKKLGRGNCLIFTGKREIDFFFKKYFKDVETLSLYLPRPVYFPFFILFFIINFFIVLFFSLLRKANKFIGFGGYTMLPGMFAAILLKKKLSIYEPNLITGRANYFISKYVDAFFYIWDETRNSLAIRKEKYFKIKPLTYQPFLQEGAESLSDKFSILLSGGSQGSHFLNNLLLNTLKLLSHDFRKKIEIYWYCGRRDFNYLAKELSELEVKIYLKDFDIELSKKYPKVDFAISRAGAQTIVELISNLVPSLLIPYPYAQKHQLANARYLHKHGACIYLEEALITPYLLKRLLEELYHDRNRLKTMRENLKNIRDSLNHGLELADVMRSYFR